MTARIQVRVLRFCMRRKIYTVLLFSYKVNILRVQCIDDIFVKKKNFYTGIRFTRDHVLF